MLSFKNVQRAMFALAALTVGAMASASVRETVTFTNVDSDGILGSAVNQIRNFTSTGGYLLGAMNFTGQITQVNTGDWASEGRVQCKHPDGAIKVMQMFTITGYSGTINGTASINWSPYRNPAGAWEYRFYESFNDGGDGSVDKLWDSLQIDYTDDVPPPPSPPTADDLGTIGDPGVTRTVTLGATQIKWLKFTITGATTGDKYLDIDTEGSTPLDTELGLYRSDTYGTRIADDDDDGEGLRSQLTFGPDATARPSAGGNGLEYNGRDGSLTAGTYYLAVGLFNTTFGDDSWNVTSTATGTGDVIVNIKTNIPGAGATVTGQVNLQDYTGDKTAPLMRFEIRDVGSTAALRTYDIHLDAMGNFSFNTDLPAGSYDISCKGSHWLRQVLSNVSLSGAHNFDVVNGDIDGDNEVTLSDYGTLATSFGNDAGGDLDGDEETTLADYGILARNFGQAGQD